MSLKISNRSTHKQQLILRKLEYYGSGKYAADNLTITEAAEIIDNLFAERVLEEKNQIQYL